MRGAVLDEAGLVRWGREVGAVADREEVFVALTGPLGAGKDAVHPGGRVPERAWTRR